MRRDADLIRDFLSGDIGGWDELIARYQGFIFGVALRMGLSDADAEDVFQEVCLKLVAHLAKLRDVDRLSSWLAAIVRQEVWRLHRKRRAGAVGGVTGDDAGAAGRTEALGPDPLDGLLALEREHHVRLALSELSPECQRLLAALYGSDPAPSYADVAQEMCMPVGSVGPRRGRCLERLRQILRQHGY